MKKIKALVSFSVPNFAKFKAGDVRPVNDELAFALVKRGVAEFAAIEEAKKSTKNKLTH